MRLWPTLIAGIMIAGCATTPKQGKIRYEGMWATLGSDQDTFNIEVFKDGTALTNYYSGPSGAKGERGRWEAKDDGILLSYDSGWRDWIQPKRQRMIFEKRGYKPGATLEDIPSNIVAAFPVSGRGTEYIGVWKLGDKQEYIALISDGAAAHSIEGGKTMKGTWRVTKAGLSIEWSNKSILTLTKSGRGRYQATRSVDGKQEVLAAVRQTGRDK